MGKRQFEKGEVIFREDVERILGPRPWMSRGDVLLAEQEEANRRKAEQMAAERAAQKEAEAAGEDTQTMPEEGQNA